MKTDEHLIVKDKDHRLKPQLKIGKQITENVNSQMSFCREVTGSDLCGLDDGEVVNPAESGPHRCSQPRCAKAHPAAESGPQIIETTRRHQSLHLSQSPAVLQPGQEVSMSLQENSYTHTLNTNTHPPLNVVQMHPLLPFAWKKTAAAV